jgi:hypothetical protein
MDDDVRTPHDIRNRLRSAFSMIAPVGLFGNARRIAFVFGVMRPLSLLRADGIGLRALLRP